MLLLLLMMLMMPLYLLLMNNDNNEEDAYDNDNQVNDFYTEILFFVGSTCEVTKTVCTNCDQPGPPCGSDSVTTNQTECYNGVDGETYFMSEYQTDSSTCHFRRCPYTLIHYAVNRVVTMMTCSQG